jgi:hypothetical protein
MLWFLESYNYFDLIIYHFSFIKSPEEDDKFIVKVRGLSLMKLRSLDETG